MNRFLRAGVCIVLLAGAAGPALGQRAAPRSGVNGTLGFGSTTRVSVNSSGAQGHRYSYDPSLSADGRYVAFRSLARLVSLDTNGVEDIYVHDRRSRTTERASVDSAGTQGNWDSWAPSLSADGRYVAFVSHASNLVPLDTNGYDDVFVRDRWSGTT